MDSDVKYPSLVLVISPSCIKEATNNDILVVNVNMKEVTWNLQYNII
jgi:hypothetical protein